MSEHTAPLQGFSDILYPEVGVWHFLEDSARRVLALYGYREIRTPILEKVEVFTRSLGEATDIVHKEMYAFRDQGDRHITLRPEGTAGVMRVVAGLGQDLKSPRLYYIGPMFRSERPQAGRKRQFHQLGLECIGKPNALQDAEVIRLQSRLFDAWGIRDAVFQLNTRGTAEDMPVVRERLRELLEPRRLELCADCQRRMDQNILRVLDCKKAACGAIAATLPPITDFMAPASREYFALVQAALAASGVRFQVNPRLIRGLDYYEHVVWEVTSASLGAQDALSGGGRYRVTVGNRAIEGVGFGIGLERVIIALGLDEPAQAAHNPGVDAFLVGQNEEAFRANLVLAEELRAAGFSVVMEMEPKSMKAQMKAADRWAARRVLIRGETEIANGTLAIRNLSTGMQVEIPASDLLSHLREALA
jgi:histidyl-tRNA synthetase